MDDIDVKSLSITTHSAWLSTAASQIFFMELGFLCLEGGYVQMEYIQTLVIKNIEDIFFGFTTYAVFGYAIATYNYEYIALYNLPYSEWDTIFVNAAFAATAATIMSGAVLERMKNVAYSLWVFIIILINYSFISRWIWDEDGWLFKLGFIDCAGCSAVHMVGGIGGLILCKFLGPRYSSLTNINDPLAQNTKKLKDKHHPRNLLIMIMGTFILWYGWIAFNTVSPIIGNVGIGGDVGLAGLLTIILPSCSSASTYAFTYVTWPKWNWIKRKGIQPGTPIIERSAENISNAILSGLVVVTASCYTINLISAMIIGIIIPFPIFLFSHYLRSKWNIDDPLDVIAIHLFGGIIGLLTEGLFNNKQGLLLTFKIKHFLIQCLGIVVTLVMNVILDIIYLLMFKYIFFRKSDIKTTPLSICLTSSRHNIYAMDHSLAFRELMFGDTKFSRSIMAKFHDYLKNIYCAEQLDFIIAVYEYRKLFQHKATAVETGINASDMNHNFNINKQIQNSFNCICELYISAESLRQVNISSRIRKRIMAIYDRLEKAENELKMKNKLQQIRGTQKIEEEEDEQHVIVNIDNEERENANLFEHIIDKTLFNDAFMETLQLTITNLRLFLQKYLDDMSWRNEKYMKDDKLYAVMHDSFIVKWFGDNDEKSKFEMMQLKKGAVQRLSTAYDWLPNDGRIKSVEEEITDILR